MITFIIMGTNVVWITPRGLIRDEVGPKFWDQVTGIEIKQKE